MRWLMWLVVEQGTGTKAKLASYEIGGKTGTAEKPGRGGFSTDRVLASFLGAFPIDDPRYLVFASLDEPQGDAGTHGFRYGGWTAAPVVAQIIDRIGPILGVPRSLPEVGRAARGPAGYAAARQGRPARRRALRLAALCDDGVRLRGAGEVEIGGLRWTRARCAPATCSRPCPARGPTAAGFSPRPWPRAPWRCWATRSSSRRPSCRRWWPRSRVRHWRGWPRDFTGRSRATVAAVTGTSGKSSVAVFTRQLWAALGKRAASIGTLGLQTTDAPGDGSLTTPDPITLHRMAAELAAGGTDHLVIEASSHGLDQHRVDGLRLAAAAFTNISRDHFDYHGSAGGLLCGQAPAVRRAAAARAPPRCSTPTSPSSATSLAWPWIGSCGSSTTARRGQALRLLRRRRRRQGQELEVELLGRRHAFRASASSAHFRPTTSWRPPASCSAGGAWPRRCCRSSPAYGRRPAGCSSWRVHPSGAPAFVDYAHKPEALAKALEALRPHTRAGS